VPMRKFRYRCGSSKKSEPGGCEKDWRMRTRDLPCLNAREESGSRLAHHQQNGGKTQKDSHRGTQRQ